MADIFVSYTSKDRLKAFWIGQELIKLGHTPRIHEWEISAGGSIPDWMEKRHHDADHVLFVISKAYLIAPYSNWERQAAQWAAADKRPNFAFPVFIEACEAPTLLAHITRCDLYGITEAEARAALAAYLSPAAIPSAPVAFSSASDVGIEEPKSSFDKMGPQAGSYYAVSNIPITIPFHFLGRDDDLAAIEKALKSGQGRAAITALHGLRGVGKTTLAAAYAEQKRAEYRAAWWIRAETESTMRADLVGLGVRLGWVAADAAEEAAAASVLAKLRDEGDDILLVYDNANNPGEIRSYLPRGGAAQIIVTSNAPNWGAVAAPVEIEVWPEEVGAHYLVARTGRREEREAAMMLSEALGGLPLAHEQAAAYCERIGVSLNGYKNRFEAAPASFMDDRRDASHEYHDGLTVAKTFALAIDEAAKLHSAAEKLIVHVALLAPEPVPLYLFLEAREQFGEPLASLAEDDFDEAIASLRAFALIDRESIPDERDVMVATDCIRLHRLVREVASERCTGCERQDMTRRLISALVAILPNGAIYNDPQVWPRMRRLEALALALVDGPESLSAGIEQSTATVLNALALYRQGALASLVSARPLFERALGIREKALGPDHLETAKSVNNLGYLLQMQGDLAGARPLLERALAINEKALGSDHTDTAKSMNNLGALLQAEGEFARARPLLERALGIREKALGPDHPDTARSANNLGYLVEAQGDFARARSLFERALAVNEKVLGSDHPDTAKSMNNLGHSLQAQGDFVGARPYYERSFAIRERALGLDHPDTALSLNNLGNLLREQGDLAGAQPYFERSLDIFERSLGIRHPSTQIVARNTSVLLDQLKMRKEAAALRKKFGLSK